MKTRATACLLSLLVTWLIGCATTKDHDPGNRVLDAVVVGRDFEPIGGSQFESHGFGNWNEETGRWYLVFEARDGEATARYRLSVNQRQYMLFQEGTDVQITLVGYMLRDVRRRS